MLPGSIIGAIYSVVNMVWSMAWQLGNAAWNAGSQIVWNIINQVSSLPGTMWNYGSQIINNLVSGIQSGFPSLSGAIQWISDHLPKSPAKIGGLSEATPEKMFNYASEMSTAFSEGIKSEINVRQPTPVIVKTGTNANNGGVGVGGTLKVVHEFPGISNGNIESYIPDNILNQLLNDPSKFLEMLAGAKGYNQRSNG